jgi:hypothetical protein
MDLRTMVWTLDEAPYYPLPYPRVGYPTTYLICIRTSVAFPRVGARVLLETCAESQQTSHQNAPIILHIRDRVQVVVIIYTCGHQRELL